MVGLEASLTSQPSLFDVPKARRARDDGIRAAGSNADREWMGKARECLRWFAGLGGSDEGEITADNIWYFMGRHYPRLSTHDPRAMGAVFKKAAAAGLIRKTDRTVKSKRPECHRRDIRIWEVVG